MEADGEGAAGLAEAVEGNPSRVSAASDDTDTVVGISYGMDAGDLGQCFPCMFFYVTYIVHSEYISM